MTTKETRIEKILRFIIKRFQGLMKIGWVFQWLFILASAEFFWFGWYWLGLLALGLSFGMHLLTVVYKGFIIEYLQRLVRADPMFGLPGRRKRNIKRKLIRKQNGVSH